MCQDWLQIKRLKQTCWWKKQQSLEKEKGQYSRSFTWFKCVTVSTVHIEKLGPAEIKVWMYRKKSFLRYIFHNREIFPAKTFDEILKTWDCEQSAQKALTSRQSFRKSCSFETIPAGQHSEEAAWKQPDTQGSQLWFTVQETSLFATSSTGDNRAKLPACDFLHSLLRLFVDRRCQPLLKRTQTILFQVSNKQHCLSLGRMRSSGFGLVEVNWICSERAFANLAIGHLNQWIKTTIFQ